MIEEYLDHFTFSHPLLSPPPPFAFEKFVLESLPLFRFLHKRAPSGLPLLPPTLLYLPFTTVPLLGLSRLQIPREAFVLSSSQAGFSHLNLLTPRAPVWPSKSTISVISTRESIKFPFSVCHLLLPFGSFFQPSPSVLHHLNLYLNQLDPPSWPLHAPSFSSPSFGPPPSSGLTLSFPA